jgi:hypothetical protein
MTSGPVVISQYSRASVSSWPAGVNSAASSVPRPLTSASTARRSGRHYTASQLLAGGFDLRNTAARLGHGGGGATTLWHYADPVPEVDRRATAYLAQLTARSTPSSPPP